MKRIFAELCVLMLLFAVVGCGSYEDLDRRMHMDTTTPTEEQIAECRELLMLNPDLKIEPVWMRREKTPEGSDITVEYWFVFKTDTADPDKIFDTSKFDTSRLRDDYTFPRTGHETKYWDTADKTFIGEYLSIGDAEEMEVGIEPNEEGGSTVYISWYETRPKK